MKLSSSHGLLFLSESSFQLLTYKQVKQSKSISLSDIKYQEGTRYKDSNELALISDETRQRYFINGVMALEKDWPERYRLEGHRIKKWFVYIPTHWLVHIRDSLPKIGSNYLLSLASLSLVSEKIRLAPEKLCYGYQSIGGATSDLFDIYGCAMEWITRITDICSQVDVVSVHLYDVNTLYSESSINALLAIEPYKPLKWQQRKQLELAKILFGSSFIVAVIATVILLWLNRQQALSIQVIGDAKSQYQTLAPPPSTVVDFVALQTSLFSIPRQIKVVSFEFDEQKILLTVLGRHERLNALLMEWQNKWPKVAWSIRTVQDTKESTYAKRLKYNNNQAQEVLHATIMGEKTSL